MRRRTVVESSNSLCRTDLPSSGLPCSGARLLAEVVVAAPSAPLSSACGVSAGVAPKLAGPALSVPVPPPLARRPEVAAPFRAMAWDSMSLKAPITSWKVGRDSGFCAQHR